MTTFNYIPARYEERKAEIDFEQHVFRRFPKLKAYFDAIIAKGIKVKNKPNSWCAWAVGMTDEQPSGQMIVDSPAPPDIDLDFSNRDPVVDYIFETYGTDHTAMVGTFLTIKTKFALRDIARYMNGGTLSNEDPVHRICRTVEIAPQSYPTEKAWLLGFTDEHDVYHRGHLEDNKELANYLDTHPDVKTLLFQILEKPRSLGKHAGGIVITPMPIDEVVPTRYFDGKKCTQISHKTLEKIGGMKIDILGVNTLNWIFDALTLIQDRHNLKLNPWDLPDDPDIWTMIGKGDAETIFQFDTNTVIPFLKRIKPKSIHDLILITSLCRPGGLDSTLEDGATVAEHFVKRANGEEKVRFLDPLLEDNLGDTHGLVVFQEQIQKIFETIGGFDPIASDNARRAVGKKDLALINSLQGKLFDNAVKNLGWSLPKCEALWQSFIGAANYSFNRAHACAYAIIAYACAFLKKRYPLEWWCSVLSFQEPEKVAEYLPSITSFIRYPNVNRPASKWKIDGDKIVAPLSLVRGCGPTAVQEILEKHVAGPFLSFVDYMLRIDKRKANKTVTLNLIVAGCFDGLPVVNDGLPETSMTAFIAKFFELRDEEIPEGYRDLGKMQMIGMRKATLPIFTLNAVKEFWDAIKTQPNFSVIQGKLPALSGCPIIQNFSKFPSLIGSWEGDICIIGLVDSAEVFYYTPKSGRNAGVKQSALRVVLSNDGRQAEFVVWSNDLTKARQTLYTGNLVSCIGLLENYRGEVVLKFKTARNLL